LRGLIDTSVFIADEQGRALAVDRLPEEWAVSVVTLAELELGVHTTQSEAIRAFRLRTLRAVQTTYVSLPIDEEVASSFAAIVAAVRSAGRRAKIQDAWIAATARAHGIAVYTQDDDFDALGVEVVRV
jgi:predicted nucleic acid-binding protein